MDERVVKELVRLGIDVTLNERLPVVGIRLDRDGSGILPLEDEVAVIEGDRTAIVTLRSASELFVGDVRPPDFANGPGDDYVLFFALIERTAADYCATRRLIDKDLEFERLYRHLRRRPDGRDANPLFSYLRAAARLYMSLRSVSRWEFESVAERLSRSARHFSQGPTSTNYFEYVGRPLLG
jgi:hypothetical protein